MAYMHPNACTHCNNGYFEGSDTECINGVLIDIDEYTEGWHRDIAYPPAPCMRCEVCKGYAWHGEEDCAACDSTGWKGGRDLSGQLLENASTQDAGDGHEPTSVPSTRNAG